MRRDRWFQCAHVTCLSGVEIPGYVEEAFERYGYLVLRRVDRVDIYLNDKRIWGKYKIFEYWIIVHEENVYLFIENLNLSSI